MGISIQLFLINGTVYTCGKNDDGQCGHGTPHNYVSPRIVESLNGSEISMVAAGGNISMALLADGSIYTWETVNVVRSASALIMESLLIHLGMVSDDE